MLRANIIRAWAGLGHHIIDLNGLGPGWALSPWAWAGPGWGLLSPWRTLLQVQKSSTSVRQRSGRCWNPARAATGCEQNGGNLNQLRHKLQPWWQHYPKCKMQPKSDMQMLPTSLAETKTKSYVQHHLFIVGRYMPQTQTLFVSKITPGRHAIFKMRFLNLSEVGRKK